MAAETRQHISRESVTPPQSWIALDSTDPIDRAAIELHDVGDALAGTMTLSLTSTEKLTHEAVVSLNLPQGTLVRGLAMVHPDRSYPASMMASGDALRAFRTREDHLRDPALLEHTSSGQHCTDRRCEPSESFQLHVFPISAKVPVTVAVEVELPRAATLDIEPTGQPLGALVVTLDGSELAHAKPLRGPKTVALPDRPGHRDWMTEDPRPVHVDTQMSLFVDDPAPAVDLTPVPIVTFHCGGEAYTQGSRDKAMIRRYVKRHIPAIRHCYELAVQRTPTLEGTVQLQFFIATTGDVAAASASGVDPDLASCVANEAKTWEFPKSEDQEQINWPFTFALGSATGTSP